MKGKYCKRTTLYYFGKPLELIFNKPEGLDLNSLISVLSYTARLFYGGSLHQLIEVSDGEFNTAADPDGDFLNPENNTKKYMITITFTDTKTFRTAHLLGSIIDLTAGELRGVLGNDVI